MQARWDEPSPETVEAHARRLEQTYGVRIDYGNPADFWKPPFKPEDAAPSYIEMTPAQPRDVASSLAGIEAALQQYPPGFVAKFTKAVFICGGLKMEGEFAGGTFGKSWIIIAARPVHGPEIMRELGSLTLHHELSSLVARANPNTLGMWRGFAPANWHQLETPRAALRASKISPPLDTGFLNAYGATNAENDFNIYAEEMFVHPEYVAQLAAKYPLIRWKLDFVMETYVTADPRFKEIFQKMGLAGS